MCWRRGWGGTRSWRRAWTSWGGRRWRRCRRRRAGEAKLVGLEMVERGIGRDGYAVFSVDGVERIGEITSGSPGPFVKKNIALAYVPVGYIEIGTEVAVEVRGQMVKAVVVATPFYKRAKSTTGAAAVAAAPVITAPLS